jgi:hypothetical protein
MAEEEPAQYPYFSTYLNHQSGSVPYGTSNNVIVEMAHDDIEAPIVRAKEKILS